MDFQLSEKKERMQIANNLKKVMNFYLIKKRDLSIFLKYLKKKKTVSGYICQAYH